MKTTTTHTVTRPHFGFLDMLLLTILLAVLVRCVQLAFGVAGLLRRAAAQGHGTQASPAVAEEA